MSSAAELWEAIEDANAVAVRHILGEHPELVEATHGGDCTPLMRAVSWYDRSVPVIRAILEAGADVNRRTSEGNTALHWAIDVNGQANLNTAEVIGVLVAAGADLTARQHWGWTPLLQAVISGTAAEVSALLAAGADPNETLPADTLPAFDAGRTTLMAALTHPKAEAVVEALLRAGADARRRDAHGADFFGYAELVRRESAGTEFAEKVRRCADLARRWPKKRKA